MDENKSLSDGMNNYYRLLKNRNVNICVKAGTKKVPSYVANGKYNKNRWGWF